MKLINPDEIYLGLDLSETNDNTSISMVSVDEDNNILVRKIEVEPVVHAHWIVLDAMEYARFDLNVFPRNEIIEERDENGNIVYYHKCTRFMKKK